jgi:hypothetical protein
MNGMRPVATLFLCALVTLPAAAAEKDDVQVSLRAEPGKLKKEGPDGKYRRGVKVTLDLTGAAAVAATHYGMLRVTEAEVEGMKLSLRKPSGTGVDLSKQMQGSVHGRTIRPGGIVEHPADGTRVLFVLGGLPVEKRPDRQGKTLTRIRGTVTLRVAGKLRTVLIPNLNADSFLVDHRGLAAAGVKAVISCDTQTGEGGKTKSGISARINEGMARIHSMTLIDRKKKDLTEALEVMLACGSMKTAGYWTLVFNGTFTRDTVLQVRLADSTRDVVVPFEAKDVPIASPGK